MSVIQYLAMRKSLILALSLLGVFISSYLGWVYTSNSRPLVCLGTGCDVVRASRYAHLWGLPLPFYGLAMYATLVVLIFGEPLASPRLAGVIRKILAGIAGASFIFSLYLTCLEGFVLHAWCAWCVASAITISLIFLLAILELVRPSPVAGAGPALFRLGNHMTILAGGVFLGAGAFLYLSQHGELPPVGQASAAALRDNLIRPESHMAGNPNAAVTVVEFGDFECPSCGQDAPVVQQVLQRYGGEIRFFFRQFPLEQIHLNALYAAEASECAAEQGQFWPFEQKLYENQADLSEQAIDRYAGELGLDKTKFDQCLASRATENTVRQDVADAHALGVDRTPTFFVDGNKIARPLTFEEFSQVLDHELLAHGSVAPPTGTTASGAPSPASSGSSTSVSDSSAAPNLLAQAGTNIFSGSQNSALACSNDEAKLEQPDLIRTAEARQLFEGTAKPVFVDVQPAKEFAAGHIPGALNLPIGEFEQHWNTLPKDRTLVLYESGRSPGDICAAGRAAGRILLAHGVPHSRIKVFQDGLAAWEKAGLPVTRQ